MTIVSDIRTVCPLATLSNTLKAPMYVVTKPRDNGDLGMIADKSADLSAIFATENGGNDEFGDNMRTMFYSYVNSGESFEGIRLVNDEISPVDSLENCEFWQQEQPDMVPNFGKMF